MRRVVITGIGIVSPIGTGLDQAWDNLLHGRSGVGPITKFDASKPPILVYAKRGSGWQLVAFEWVFPEKPAKKESKS